MSRRGNRESWIPDQPNSRGYWEASVWMGAKGDGSPDRRHIQRKTRAARNRAVRELERKRDAGVTGKSGKRTVEQVLTRHLEVVLPARGRAPRTIADYWSKCRNDIFPRWGGARIERLLPEQVEDGIAEMLAAGHAPSHVRKVIAILSSVYEIEVRRGNVARNPCSLAGGIELPLRERKALNPQQARAVLAAIEKRRSRARWKTGLACGLRQGEALGLRWDYVGARQLRVWWQLQRLTWQHGCSPPCGRPRGADCPARHGGGLVLREIKERKRKNVPLDDLLGGFLAEHRSQQAAERAAAGDLWQDGGFVFCQGDGRPIDPRADWQEWKEILEEAGVPHVGVHGARHSAATFAIAEGVALPVVQEILGHSDIRVTREYVDVSTPMAADGIKRVSRALFGLPDGGEDQVDAFAKMLEEMGPDDFGGPR